MVAMIQCSKRCSRSVYRRLILPFTAPQIIHSALFTVLGSENKLVYWSTASSSLCQSPLTLPKCMNADMTQAKLVAFCCFFFLSFFKAQLYILVNFINRLEEDINAVVVFYKVLRSQWCIRSVHRSWDCAWFQQSCFQQVCNSFRITNNIPILSWP